MKWALKAMLRLVAMATRLLLQAEDARFHDDFILFGIFWGCSLYFSDEIGPANCIFYQNKSHVNVSTYEHLSNKCYRGVESPSTVIGREKHASQSASSNDHTPLTHLQGFTTMILMNIALKLYLRSDCTRK